MKLTTLFLLIALPFLCLAQDGANTAQQDIAHFQEELNAEYKNPDKSPLDAKALKKFKKHDFFPVDMKYRVVAQLMITENTPFFQMKTTGNRLPQYRKFGFVHFTLDGMDYVLPVYQSKDLMNRKEYEDYLFLPFTDRSNGKESYEGGRYLEVRIPKEGNEVVVDFNKAYNPYCAYSDRYACPLVPQENHLDTEIKAGVRFLKKGK